MNFTLLSLQKKLLISFISNKPPRNSSILYVEHGYFIELTMRTQCILNILQQMYDSLKTLLWTEEQNVLNQTTVVNIRITSV